MKSKFSLHLVKTRLILSILLLLIFIERVYTYFHFSVVYTDSDQTLLWNAANDMLQGKFYQPCFYGQNYNPLIEPLFAMPFLYFGMEVYQALPLVTLLMGIIPFLLFSYYFYLKINPVSAIIPLVICLLLPLEYTMETTISRGFVTGIFFASFAFVLMAFHRSFLSKFLGGILVGFALYVNANCVLLFPLLIPFINWNLKDFIRFISPIFLGFLLGISTLFFNNYFYFQHPEMLVHGPIKLSISLNSFLNVLSKLDNYFDFITPIVWRSGWLSMLVFILIGIRLWKYKFKNESIMVFLIFILILFTFSVSKVSEANYSVFFSGSRMYLTYPLIWIFLVSFLLKTWNEKQSKEILKVLISLSFIAFSIKIFAFNFLLKNALREENYSLVKVEKIKILKEKCQEILSFSDKRIDLVLANAGTTPDQIIAYGCPCLLDDFPKTYLSTYERRTWIEPNILNEKFERIYLFGWDKNVWNQMDFKQIKILNKDTIENRFLIENTLSTKEFLEQINLSK